MNEYLNDAFRKAASFCVYQERTKKEVRDRLTKWEITGDDAETIIAELIGQDYLNEARFATIFAGSKFRVQHWGKRRIRQELQQRGIGGDGLDQAMLAIETDDYRATLTDLLAKKRRTLHDDNPMTVKQKLVRYAMSKGYESSLIFSVLGQPDEDSDE
jgi:regulatory protein